MAIIIKCKSCRERLYDGYIKCPACGAMEKTFTIDYWPDGRNGRRIRKTLDSVSDYELAQELDKETRSSIAARRNPDNAKNISQYNATFADLYQEYLDWCKLHTLAGPNKEKTLRVRTYVWQYILRIIGNDPVLNFDKNSVTLYQKTRQAQGVGNKTINNELFEVNSFRSWCRNEKDFDLDPIPIKKLPHERPIPIILSLNEVISLVDVAPPYYKALYLCLYTLGWRFSEAQYLKGEYIDFENKTIKALQKGGTWKVSDLNKWLAGALKKLKTKPGEYVFKGRRKMIDEKTGKMVPAPIQDIRRPLARDTKAAGIKKHVNPHLLRHCIATHLLAKEKNLRTIQQLLGHAHIGTTQWYTQVNVNDIHEATETMFNEMFNNKKIVSTRKARK